MIEDGTLSHKNWLCCNFYDDLKFKKKTAMPLEKEKKKKIIEKSLFCTRIQRKDYCYLTELYVFFKYRFLTNVVTAFNI